MAMLRIPGVINWYIGLHADAQPTGVPVGSRLIEYDTKDIYITYDGDTWSAFETRDGDIADLNTVLGAVDSAIVAAGAEGDISAKLRRATQGLEDLKTLVVLATGSNAIGKLAANSGIDIGDVDILSIATGANVIGKVGIDQTTPGTTNLVAEGNSADIKTAVEIIDNFISGSRGLVTEDNSGSIKTAVEAIQVAVGDMEAGTYSAPLTYAVTNGATNEIIAANATRTQLTITNISDTVIFLGVGNAAVLNSGLPIYPAGGVAQFGGAGGMKLTLQAVNGIHAAGVNKNVAIQEVE